MSRSVSTLKFVGTGSLGLLTGLSYSLSTVSIPSIMTIPTASAASRALEATSSNCQITSLTTFTSAAFLAAYALSPRNLRHPYLLYVSLLTFSSSFAHDILSFVPHSWLAPFTSTPRPPYYPAQAKNQSSSKYTPPGSSVGSSTTNRMEQSYEMLPDSHSDDDGTTSATEETADETHAAVPAPPTHNELVQSENLRRQLVSYQQQFVVRTGINLLGFAMAIVGLWGDGIAQVVEASETYVFEL